VGDKYELIERPYPNLSIKRLYNLMEERETDVDAYTQLAGMFEILTPSWRVQYGGLAAAYSQ